MLGAGVVLRGPDGCRRPPALMRELAPGLDRYGAEVTVTSCGDRVIAPALRLTAARLASPMAAPAGQQAAARLLLWQVDLLWRRRIIDYVLLRAVRP